MAAIIGEAESILSRTRSKRVSERTAVAGDGLWLAPAKPVLRVLSLTGSIRLPKSPLYLKLHE